MVTEGEKVELVDLELLQLWRGGGRGEVEAGETAVGGEEAEGGVLAEAGEDSHPGNLLAANSC